jgi:hypothetical protein
MKVIATDKQRAKLEAAWQEPISWARYERRWIVDTKNWPESRRVDFMWLAMSVGAFAT